MKHSLTAVLAIVSAAGLAGIAQAQTTASPAAAPGDETTAPSTQSQSSIAPASPSAAQPTTAATAPKAAPQANLQQSSANNDFWSHNLSQDEVRQAQQQLAAQGLYRGPVDGLAGPEMQRALTRFQQQNGLRRTATLDPDTMNRLMASNAPAPGASASPTGPAVGASTPPASTNAPIGAGGGTATAPSSTQGQPTSR